MRNYLVGNTRWKFGALSEFRNELFGIAIIGVIVVHGLSQYFRLPVDFVQKGILRLCGLVLTEGFLFLSGIGLWFSCSKGVKIKDFYRNRTKRIVLPWLVIAVPLFAVFDLVIRGNPGKFILDVSTLYFWVKHNNGTWYVSVVIVLYALFPLTYYAFLRWRVLSLIVVNAGILILLLITKLDFPEVFDRIARGLGVSQVPAFFVGVFVGPLVKNDAFMKKWHLYAYLALLGGLRILRDVDVIIEQYYTLLERLFTTALICISLRWIKYTHVASFFRYCGTRSLELYLAHILLIPIFKTFNLTYGFLNSYRGVIEYGLIVVLSFFAANLSQRITRSS